MAKITAYTELTTPAPEDILVIVDDPAGTPTTKKVTIANVVTLTQNWQLAYNGGFF